VSRFTEELLVSPLPDGRTWVIRRDFGYDVGEEGSGNTIDVPMGFKTDFASVPRLLWSVIPRWGKYGNAAVIHDFLYWEQDRTREESDRIFLEAMRVLKVSFMIRTLIYYAVRFFGWYAWYRNRGKRLKNPERKTHKGLLPREAPHDIQN
jgi:hypothetical protein